MKLRPATKYQRHNLDTAIEHLKHARDLLKMANCPKTLRRCRLTLTSAGGAQRHMVGRMMRGSK